MATTSAPITAVIMTNVIISPVVLTNIPFVGTVVDVAIVVVVMDVLMYSIVMVILAESVCDIVSSDVSSRVVVCGVTTITLGVNVLLISYPSSPKVLWSALIRAAAGDTCLILYR